MTQEQKNDREGRCIGIGLIIAVLIALCLICWGWAAIDHFWPNEWYSTPLGCTWVCAVLIAAAFIWVLTTEWMLWKIGVYTKQEKSTKADEKAK